MKTQNIQISFQTSYLLMLETLLEKISAAAKAGSLDWAACDFEVTLEYNAHLETQSVEPLKAFIESQNRAFGIGIGIDHTFEDSETNAA